MTASSRQDCTSGVVDSFRKMVNCKKLQLFGNSEQLKSIVLCGLFSNLSKTSKKGESPHEHVCFIIRHGVARPNVDSIHIVIQLRFIVLGVIAKLAKTSENGGGHVENR